MKKQIHFQVEALSNGYVVTFFADPGSAARIAEAFGGAVDSTYCKDESEIKELVARKIDRELGNKKS